MQTQQKEPMTHWSTHSWKLPAILTAALTVLSAAHLALVLTLLQCSLFSTSDPAQILVPSILSIIPMLLLGACYAAMTVFVLRTQTRQGLQDGAHGRISWVALPGFAVALVTACSIFVRAVIIAQTVSTVDLTIFYYLSNNLPLFIISIVEAALPVLVAALLMPVLMKRINLTVGALAIAGVLYVPSLVTLGYHMLSGKETMLLSWLVILPLHQIASALVAVALFVAVRRRLWDALALNWGLSLLLDSLTVLWRSVIGWNLPDWFKGMLQVLFWLQGLIALYCLIQWDRGASPADPFKALARKIRALSGHFLPL